MVPTTTDRYVSRCTSDREPEQAARRGRSHRKVLSTTPARKLQLKLSTDRPGIQVRCRCVRRFPASRRLGERANFFSHRIHPRPPSPQLLRIHPTRHHHSLFCIPSNGRHAEGNPTAHPPASDHIPGPGHLLSHLRRRHIKCAADARRRKLLLHSKPID